MSKEINVGDVFECVRVGATELSTFEITEITPVYYAARWSDDAPGHWCKTTLLEHLSDGRVRRIHMSEPAVSRLPVQKITPPSAQPITQSAIRAILPSAFCQVSIMDAIRQLVQFYTSHQSRPTDSDRATTAQELQTLVDRMRKERIANVLPQHEELMCDNEWFEPSE